MTTDATIDCLIGELDEIFARRGLSPDEKQKVWETILQVAEWRMQQEEPFDAAKLARDIPDPRTWARVALESPELLRLLEQHHTPGSFGAWLKDAIAEESSRRRAGNIIDIESRRDRS
jgi:hypothetical protein